MANLVTPMPMIRARFFDDNGRPLSGGKIYTYEPNTTTPKTTYKDLAATTPNTNPILLDVAGEADIYLDGQYRVIVESWRGEQLYDKDNVGGLAQIKASFVVDASGKTQQQINDSAFIRSPQFFGAKGGAIDDQTVFTNLSTNYAYALSKEYTVPVWRTQATKFIGNGTKVNLDSVNGDTTVCLQIRNNANYSDIDFVNNPNDAKAWTYSVIGNNSVLTNVGFYNFDDPNVVKNSWGIYLEDRENITLNNPKFGGNGVSDIAILDNVKNITIINAKNTVNPDGAHIDIEPNGAGNIENINIIGGKYSAINVLENDFLSNGIKSLNIIGANVKLLELRGGQTKIIGGKVEKIKGNWANTLDFEGMQNEYFCTLEVDNVNLSKNLIEDEFINSLSSSDANSFWSIFAPSGISIQRYKDENGYYLSVNKNKIGTHVLFSRDYISLPPGSGVLCIAMSYSVENTGADTMFQPCYVDFYNDSDAQVGASYSLKGGRTANGTNYDWSNEVSIFDIPAGATKFKIFFRCNKTGSTLKLRKVGAHALTIVDVAGNFNEIISSYKQPNLKNSYTQNTVPTDLSYGYDGLIVETPLASYSYSGYINTFSLITVGKRKLYASHSDNFSLANGATSTTSITVNGAVMGQTVKVGFNQSLGGGVQMYGEVSSTNNVSFYVRNNSGASITINGTFNIVVE